MSRIPVTEVHPSNDPTPTLVDDVPAHATEQPSHLRRRRDDNTHVFVIHIIAGSDTVQFATVLPGETMTLGRDPTCGFHVHDGRISRQHLTIECHENNRGCTIEDLDSKNGTQLDGEALDQPVLIRQRGDVRVGDSLLRIERMTCAQMSYMDRHLRQVKEASLDSLTRLLSRRTLYERVPGMLKEHLASGTTVSAIFIDVDHFKTINDAHGHLAGDNILRGVAGILKDATRQRDRVFRYGGDEFLLILSGCDLEGAHATAQRILNRTTAAQWLVNAHTPIHLSLSAGVTQYSGGSLDMLIDGADQTMLKAKKCGRNIALCMPAG